MDRERLQQVDQTAACILLGQTETNNSMRARHRSLWRTFRGLYSPGAIILLGFLSSCELTESLCLDYDDWEFENVTDQDVVVTPLYTGHDGREKVVPRHGLQQTRFAIAARERREINLETGDFPFERILVEARAVAPWIIDVNISDTRISVGEVGSPATSAHLAATREPMFRRIKLYLVALAIPLTWSLPIFFHRARRWPRSTSPPT